MIVELCQRGEEEPRGVGGTIVHVRMTMIGIGDIHGGAGVGCPAGGSCQVGCTLAG